MATGPSRCADTHVYLLIQETKTSLCSSGNNMATQSACVHICIWHCKSSKTLDNIGNETLGQDVSLQHAHSSI